MIIMDNKQIKRTNCKHRLLTLFKSSHRHTFLLEMDGQFKFFIFFPRQKSLAFSPLSPSFGEQTNKEHRQHRFKYIIPSIFFLIKADRNEGIPRSPVRPFMSLLHLQSLFFLLDPLDNVWQAPGGSFNAHRNKTLSLLFKNNNSKQSHIREGPFQFFFKFLKMSLYKLYKPQLLIHIYSA